MGGLLKGGGGVVQRGGEGLFKGKGWGSLAGRSLLPLPPSKEQRGERGLLLRRERGVLLKKGGGGGCCKREGKRIVENVDPSPEGEKFPVIALDYQHRRSASALFL